MAVLVTASLVPAPGAADSVERVATTPYVAAGAAATYADGIHAFFGGYGLTEANQIALYEGDNARWSATSARLPRAMWGMAAAVGSNGNTYLFGGCCDDPAPERPTNGDAWGEIYRWDASARTLTDIGDGPELVGGTAAPYGDVLYLFGGAYHLDEGIASGFDHFVHRFDVATETLTTLDVGYPAARWASTAVVDGDRILIVGGDGADGACNIIAFDPGTETFDDDEMPIPCRAWASVALIEGSVYLAGGVNNTEAGPFTIFDDVVRIDLATGDATTLPARLPQARTAMGSSSDGTRMIVFGGQTVDGMAADLVVVHPHTPSAPRDLTATPGPGRGQISLAWTAPDHDDGVTGYRVYRGQVSNIPAMALVATVGTATSFTDTTGGDGATWHYRIRALNDDGQGPPSNAASAKTGTKPGAPTGLDVMPTGVPGELRLSWSAPANTGGLPLGSYAIKRVSGSGTPAVTVATVAGTETTWTDAARDLGVWSYSVVAVNPVGASVPSAAARGVGTAPPTI